jgi:nucleotide-binding universal stress UspA family protein
MRFALCLQDFDASGETLGPFLRFASVCKASVEVIHVRPFSSNTPAVRRSQNGRDDVHTEEAANKARATAERSLKHLMADCPVPLGITIVPGPNVARSIVTRCQAEGFDLIALTLWRSPEEERFPRIGSITSEVVKSARVPVYLFHPRVGSNVATENDALTVGSFVFTADGYELGVIREVLADRFKVGRENEVAWWLPGKALASAVNCRTELRFTRAAIDEYVLPEPVAQPNGRLHSDDSPVRAIYDRGLL